MRKQWLWLLALLAAATYVGAQSPLTNMRIDAEATGNVVVIPLHAFEWAAICEGGIPYNPQWNYKSGGEGPAPTCVEGTNVTFGTAQFDDVTVQNLQGLLVLPPDWSGAIDLKLTWRSGATTGNVVWQISTACVADGEAMDPSFNAAQLLTDATQGTANRRNSATLSSVTTTGCAAGETFFFKILRDGGHASDTIANAAHLLTADFTYRRAM